MNFTFNGKYPENINYNGTPLNKLQYNGVTVWKKEVDYSQYPLGFKVYDGSVSFYFSMNALTKVIPVLYTSYDRTNWTVWLDITQPITVNDGLTLYIYGNYTNLFTTGDNPKTQQTINLKSSGTGKFDVVGQFLSIRNPNWTNPITNILSSLSTAITPRFALYMQFFTGCKNNLYNAKDMHINVKDCYSKNSYNINLGYLFDGCLHLQEGCLFDYDMTTSGYATFIGFYRGCTSLISAEMPPLMSGGGRDYEVMFDGASSINKITYRGSVSVSSGNFSRNMSPTGTFYNLGGASYSTGTSGIPSGWTVKTQLD